jgi:hypothetical protein
VPSLLADRMADPVEISPEAAEAAVEAAETEPVPERLS